MKKIIISLILLLIFSSCGKINNQENNNEKIKISKNIETIQKEGININNNLKQDNKKEIIIGGEKFILDKDKLLEGIKGEYYYDNLFITTLNGIGNVCGLYTNRIPKDISYKCDGPLIKSNKYYYCKNNNNLLTQFEFGRIGSKIGGCGGYQEKWQKLYIKKINGKDFIFIGDLYGEGTDSDKNHNNYKEIYNKYSNKEYLNKILKNKKNTELIKKWDNIVNNF